MTVPAAPTRELVGASRPGEPDRRSKPPAGPGVLANEAAAAWTRAELVHRFGRHALDRALRAGTLTRALPGIYLGSRYSASFDGRVAAASRWAGQRGTIGGVAAAILHGLLAQPPRRITVIVRPCDRLRAPDWIVAKCLNLPMRPVVIRGMAVVPTTDALLQSWADLPPETRTAAVIDAVRERRVSLTDLASRLAAYPRLRHRRALERLLRLLADGPESYLEYLAVTRVFNTREFSGFRRQVSMRSLGERYLLDMFHDETLVAIELDGRRYHGDDAQRRRDLERDANLAAVGILTLRFTFEDIAGRPEWCRSRTRRALAARRRVGRSRAAPGPGPQVDT